MAITLVTNNVDPSGFVANGNTSDLSGCETLVASVTGKSIYIEKIVVSFGAAISVTIGEGESASGVDAVIVGPIYGAANSSIELEYTRPIKLTSATALTADSSGAGSVTMVIQGYIE